MMTKRIAAIDIGTNSTKMTVAEAGVDGIAIVFERSEVTRLGKGVDAAGLLDASAIERTLDAVTRFADEARAANATTILCAGTSALRDARNGAEVIAGARERAGVEIEIIDGDREAQFAYAAVRFDGTLGLGDIPKLVVFDIGGGSTELIAGGASGMERYCSLDIGAVRLTERFIASDPPTASEIAMVEQYASAALQTFPRTDGGVAVAGIGGTAVNVGAILAGGNSDIHGTTVTLAQVEEVGRRLRGCPLAERRAIPGLEPARADVIVAGVVILEQLLRSFEASQFTVSTRGLRYGLIAEYLSQNQ